MNNSKQIKLKTYREYTSLHTGQQASRPVCEPIKKKRSLTYALSGEISLFTLQFGEDFQKLLQESNKLSSQIILVLDVRRSLGETGPDGLFNIQDAG